MFNLSDTIAAICTPPGMGSMAAIRISGSNSWNIIERFFFQSSTHQHINTPVHLEHMHALHGYIKDGEKIIDEVIVLPFKSPHSFTSEDTIEIFCHGSTHIASMILDLCLKNGARIAKPGEFTFRAFVNGRIDLTEAEAINELICADSPRLIQGASEMLTGSLKEKIKFFREELLNLITTIESAIEFPQDVDSISKENIITKLSEIKLNINSLIESAKEGQLLREGLKVSIIGTPNVGKSSLLNRLLENERAIVTSEPGTTRDILEEKITIDGWPIVLVDTAGIRHEADLNESEKLGIERSKIALQISDIALVLFDLTKGMNRETKELIGLANGKQKIIVGNKIDLTDVGLSRDSNSRSTYPYDIAISAKHGTNLDKLKTLIIDRIRSVSQNNSKGFENNIYINQRQKELLLQCSANIDYALELCNKKSTEDILADELKKALSKLDEVSGRIINDDVISNIFAKFCIGK